MKYDQEYNNKIILIFAISFFVLILLNTFLIGNLADEIQKCKIDNIIKFENQQLNNQRKIDSLYHEIKLDSIKYNIK